MKHVSQPGSIRVGIGGWTFAPWRGVFYPPGLPHARELSHASRRLSAIEINGTFYRTQSPASFRKWADETPDNFVFAVKGHKAVVSKSKLAEAGDAIAWFLDSGVLELKEKLGPILWQFAPTRRFDEADIAAFLKLLPAGRTGLSLRHALEVRHESFVDPKFVTLAREANAAIVVSDSDDYPCLADSTADFVYVRLQRGHDDEPTCYPAEAIEAWANRVELWAGGSDPEGLPQAGEKAGSAGKRDVFVFFIHHGKVRAPAGAEAMLTHRKADTP